MREDDMLARRQRHGPTSGLTKKPRPGVRSPRFRRAPPAGPGGADPQMFRVAFAAAVGTIVEWYDFFVYGAAAALVFNRLFFPTSDPRVGVLLAFGTSATGFLARPVGALVAGHYGDRIGRKAILVATLLTMGTSTVAIGLLPTYGSIGLLAPALLLVLRIAQGFATGGEWGGAALLTVESARAGRRGFWGSLITVGIMLGLVLASLTFSLLSATLSEAQFLAWGWRIPFLASAALIAIGWYSRSNVHETPAFGELADAGTRSRRPLTDALRAWRGMLAIFLIRIAENFSFYTFTAFSLYYVSDVLHMPRAVILDAIIVAALAECATAVAFGLLSDRVGGRRVLLFGLYTQAAFALPFFRLLDTRSPAAIDLALVVGFAVANGAISSVQPDYFSRLFPARIRFSGVSIGRESATVLAAGLGPILATSLVSWTGASWPVAACMMATSVLGIGAVLAVPR